MKEYGENFWKSLIEKYSQSSLPIKDFCKDQKVSVSSFNRWKTKLQNKDFQNSQKQEDFIEALPKQPAFEQTPPKQYLTIRTSYGYVIEVPL